MRNTGSLGKGSTAGDRLRRSGERRERFGQKGETPVENLIVIGASAGGLEALKDVLRGLSDEIPAAVIIMLHMGRTGEYQLKNVLRESTAVPIVAVQTGARLERGTIYVTRPGQSVFLQGRVLRIEPQKKEGLVTTINRLFESAAQQYQDRVIGVILSGLLSDGTAGLRAVHGAGGLTIVQDPGEAEFPDMPRNAMRDLPVTFSLHAADIGLALDILTRRTTALETGLAVSVRMLKERLQVLVRLLAQSKHNPGTHTFLLTEMTALRADLRSVQGLLDQAIALVPKGKRSSS
jgi:two-component system chemotaxis response regulator CheB